MRFFINIICNSNIFLSFRMELLKNKGFPNKQIKKNILKIDSSNFALSNVYSKHIFRKIIKMIEISFLLLLLLIIDFFFEIFKKSINKQNIKYPNKHLHNCYQKFELVKKNDLNNFHLIKDLKFYINPIPYGYNKELSIDNGYKPLLNYKYLIHQFWKGKIGRIHLLSIKSLLIIQKNFRYELWLWIDGKKNYQFTIKMKEIKELQNIFPYFKIKLWKVTEEIKNTPFEAIDWYFLRQKPYQFLSDDFRIISLYKYGGLYFDMDFLFLKDLSPLLQYEFITQWGNQNYGNSAAIHFKKDSKNIRYVVYKFIDMQCSQPYTLFSYTDKNFRNITLLPNYVFDHHWAISYSPFKNRGFKGFFLDKIENITSANISLQNFFPNSYAFHWHNCWQCTIKRNNYIGIIENEINEILLNIKIKKK